MRILRLLGRLLRCHHPHFLHPLLRQLCAFACCDGGVEAVGGFLDGFAGCDFNFGGGDDGGSRY
jgi:hypothetical protein